MVTPFQRLKPGESVHVAVTKYCSYVIKHDGWGLRITASSGPIVVRHLPDGSVSIGSAGPVENDEGVSHA